MSLIITECGWLDARHQDVSLQIVCEPQKLHVSLPLRSNSSVALMTGKGSDLDSDLNFAA